MKRANMVSSLIAIVIAAFFLITTFQFKVMDVQDTGPAFLPRIYSGVLIFLSLLLILKSMKSNDQQEKSRDQNGEGSKINVVFITMLLIVGLVIAIPFLGFYIATIIGIFIFLMLCKERRYYILIGVPLGVPLFIFIIFQKLLLVPIPLGTLFQ